jgi:hypothetical protein
MNRRGQILPTVHQKSTKFRYLIFFPAATTAQNGQKYKSMLETWPTNPFFDHAGVEYCLVDTA